MITGNMTIQLPDGTVYTSDIFILDNICHIVNNLSITL